MKQLPQSMIVGFIMMALATALAACSPSSTPVSEISSDATAVTTPSTGLYQTLTVDEFASIVANESDQYTIVNVHIPYEGEVAETDLSIPYNDIEALTRALPDPNVPIILYCRSGRMSEEASRALIDLGYTQLWDVPGGMIAWESSGRELLNREQ
ncbi:rhodanese-like domain-containing protein [Kamptonema cortianum]|nr:rhodanese-like domain-containing protein [Kamptonema cortianum]